MADSSGLVEDNELIYRRVVQTTNFYNQNQNPALSTMAFKPTDADVDGISVTRATLLQGNAEAAAALGFAGKNYYIIELVAGDLRNEGLTVVADPSTNDPSHAIIPALNKATRNLPEVKNLMDRARRLNFNVYGPFPGKQPFPKT